MKTPTLLEAIQTTSLSGGFMDSRVQGDMIGCRLGILKQSIIGLLFRALYLHIMNITQLLLSGGSIQAIGGVVAL